MNMSYCMFENTSLAMSQLLKAMQEANSIEDLELSSDERQAYDKLYNQCTAFLMGSERLEEDEYDQEYDEGNEDRGLESCRD